MTMPMECTQTITSPNTLSDYYLDLLAEMIGDVCESCETTEDVSIQIDPYDQDVHNTLRYAPLCDACYDRYAEDI